ncbi:hypothetical protein [Desulfotruncus alcoholivorax]|uniref:hypothetical protein n=1 Tax=Desulfotruncus alcoholivorax TaxID=265477 RepID=UPI000406BFCE|nr:hypothetical protein [Desulfotruncus alcoholivorax]
MMTSPIVYEHYAIYSAYYLGDAACDQTSDMIIFLKNNIPQYTHEDVLRFLTDKEFRQSVVAPLETDIPALVNLDKKWYREYEKQIGKKNWWRKAVRIVSKLIDLPDPKPLKPGSIEMEIYQTILNSEQYIIPVVYKHIDENNPKKHDVFYKDELLKYFNIYGVKFQEFYFARLNNCVPYMELEFEYYHTWAKKTFEIYLPYGEMKKLYEKIYKEKYPEKYRYVYV